MRGAFGGPPPPPPPPAAAPPPPPPPPRRPPGRLATATTTFLLCDVQERFRDIIWHMPSVIATSRLLLAVARELAVPVVATEQYSKVFGPTVAELALDDAVAAGRAARFEKRRFSMLTPDVSAALDPARASAVVFGVEAHVCVQQTCLDLLERGVDVTVVADGAATLLARVGDDAEAPALSSLTGCSSQRPLDRMVALRRLQAAGAVVSTAEAVIFELLQTSDSADQPAFKPCSALLKARNDGLDAAAQGELLAAT